MSDRISTITAFLIIIFIAMALFSGVFGYWKYMSLKSEVVSPEVRNSNTVNKELSAENAVNLVRDLPEVQEWLRLFKVTDTPVKPIIEIDHKTETAYVVHVYEWNSDHNTTFNWYDVDIRTGLVTKEF